MSTNPGNDNSVFGNFHLKLALPRKSFKNPAIPALRQKRSTGAQRMADCGKITVVDLPCWETSFNGTELLNYLQ